MSLMKRHNLYPLLYESCKVVKGASKSLICDIQRQAYRVIPNDLADLLQCNRNKSVREILEVYNGQFDKEILSNLEFLEKEDLLFFTEHPEWFPEMSLEWRTASLVTNAVIDISDKTNFIYEDLWQVLSDLGCEHVQIRYFVEIDIEKLDIYLSAIKNLRIVSVEVLLPFSENMNINSWIDFVQRTPRIV